jgi:hypothetical protein
LDAEMPPEEQAASPMVKVAASIGRQRLVFMAIGHPYYSSL